MSEFTHLHVHTQFSILDGAAKIKNLFARAKETGMKSLAITDHGNMYGAMTFMNEAKDAGIKPLIGCETYCAHNSRFEKDNRGHHLILIAKNLEGYRNLAKLSTFAFKEGFYYNPRIDKELLRKYSKGIIASSACLGGEIPQAILRGNIEKAELAIQEFLEIFGEDFYLELMRHGLEEQNKVNEVVVGLAKKYNVKVIATNDVHYIHADDFEAHHVLICINTDSDFENSEGLSYTGQEYLKTPEEMAELFADIPEALSNTQEIVDKVEYFQLENPIMLPEFPVPEGFVDQDDYLAYLTFEGAKVFYEDITEEIQERLDFELTTIKRMGFPGYFLIVSDFIRAAREMGVMVGPGRGSAAGSAVAFCTGITAIDPLKYNLLFERFLNPDRISMPDIDVDFDDEGRDKVLDYVINKYGENRVAQIVTFGTMAAKSAIRDVGRVLKVKQFDINRLAKLVPEKPGTTLESAFKEVPELNNELKSPDELIRRTLKFAEILEGSSRHTGTHACGVIIGPDDLSNYLPLANAKDSKMMVTQYEGKYVESAGMLKMDFLGLKTLSIIREAISNIKETENITIDIDTIPLDDEATFALYQRGETIGTFQFESEGMRQYLRELKPTSIEDLIAMNALYRPGPMQFIPTFINRKHGKEKVEYPHEMLEPLLKSTYGIMVYQEQIMQAAQIMGGFSLGKADLLRRAMGKKQRDVMEQQKLIFIDGALEKGVTKENAEVVFDTMAKFADYGFNRSHSAAYSLIAYQTAYLKARHPAQYMAGVLTHNLSDIKKITFFIEECLRTGIPVLGPDINESRMNFFVNSKKQIRFGLGAIKNVGEAAVSHIIEERSLNGPFANFTDFLLRLNLRTVNKKCIEALAMAGAFDTFENVHRAQYFYKEREDDSAFFEKAIRTAAIHIERQNSAQVSLFGDVEEFNTPEIEFPECPRWSKIEQLRLEKQVTGFYISGHPLDVYKTEIDNYCNIGLSDLKDDLSPYKTSELTFAGLVSTVSHRLTSNGKPFGSFSLEDFSDTLNMNIFSEDYLKFKHMLVEEQCILVKARIGSRFKSEQLEIKITSMHLLPEVLEKYVSAIHLSVSLSEITQENMQLLENLIQQNSGSCMLKFGIYDLGNNIILNFNTAKHKVNPPDFIKALKKQNIFRFKLSKRVF
ncbi:MAG: DNA polymerase III subunit alpha [Bacteroidales bacterium]|nr:DNA polymerase III subunit alpha [Bacteroidales bacterium]